MTLISFYDKYGDYCFVNPDKMIQGYVSHNDPDECRFHCDTKEMEYDYDMDQETAMNIIASLRHLSA